MHRKVFIPHKGRGPFRPVYKQAVHRPSVFTRLKAQVSIPIPPGMGKLKQTLCYASTLRSESRPFLCPFKMERSAKIPTPIPLGPRDQYPRFVFLVLAE